MKQVDDLIMDSPFYGKSAKEILEHFKSYRFVDDHGHHLELCKDFTELVNLAAQARAE
ncbi:hypothetical protein [Pantoea sp. CCBC3-3-1]|uniref:hypothetical protein n=1 Tax=Pantoea sp. CCBC3-3-1 TaxID=2490851 RepID=UPI00143E0C61|nr:hypothetical protein [Pantoea sp. CCBC3-3-1]